VPLTTHFDETERVLTIAVNGRFDFNLHRQFREAYKNRVGDGTRYVVDLQGTDYMDSSALGMLLLLREHAGGDKAGIRIVHCNSEIGKILSISNFHRLFDIS